MKLVMMNKKMMKRTAECYTAVTSQPLKVTIFLKQSQNKF